ncbi:hypothetical protein VN97_g2564 [Penicillium thymicola]|uniref:Uncharacterized protein n=1 Tax=Penicillium thymicola TaxID=293382 RepID=A0AAI9XC39_PENTH|nr:hypothetical protein VN97_g2564 [Penicillium thymicola]
MANQSPLLNRLGIILKAKKYVALWDLMTREGITNTYHNQSLVVNPVQIPRLESELDVITKSLGKKAAPDLHSRSEDIFNNLSVELRHEIFKLLPAGSILALKAASLAMHSTTLPYGLWKRTLRSEIPWLWEVHDIDAFQSQEVEDNISKLLLDIQKKSRYTSKSDDYIFGLANRRRIWGVCEQIRSRLWLFDSASLQSAVCSRDEAVAEVAPYLILGSGSIPGSRLAATNSFLSLFFFFFSL